MTPEQEAICERVEAELHASAHLDCVPSTRDVIARTQLAHDLCDLGHISHVDRERVIADLLDDRPVRL